LKFIILLFFINDYSRCWLWGKGGIEMAFSAEKEKAITGNGSKSPLIDVGGGPWRSAEAPDGRTDKRGQEHFNKRYKSTNEFSEA